MDRSAGFYGDVLGLGEIVNRTKVAGIRWFSMGEGKEFHLISVVGEPVPVNRAVHFALTTPAFDDVLRTLEKSGVKFSNWSGETGKVTVRADRTRQVYIQDVGGYWIEVNSVASD